MVDSTLYPFREAEALPSIPDLPDLLLTPDGKRVETAGQWLSLREYYKAMAAFYMFGNVPPAPTRVDVLTVSTETSRDGSRTYMLLDIIVRDIGGSGQDFSFRARRILPSRPAGGRVIVKNSGNPLEPCPIEDRLVSEGIELITFDRTGLAPDGPGIDTGIFPYFPALGMKVLGAWAWGHMAVNTWLHTRNPAAAPPRICIMGHSRGGKATTCAGIMDERIDVVTSSGSGCGGAGCYRYAAEMNPKVETVGNITRAFPYWFADRLATFAEREDRLPFDLHTLKALIAPRALITTEGNQDYWSNPVGTGITSRAAQPVFDLLGASERNAVYYRDGGHAQNEKDWTAIVEFFIKVTS